MSTSTTSKTSKIPTKAIFVVGDVTANQWQLNIGGAIVAKNSSHELCTVSVRGWGMPYKRSSELRNELILAIAIQHAVDKNWTLQKILDELDIETTQYKKENGH